MIVTCPFTGYKVSRPLFPADNFLQPHAIFTANKHELAAAISRKENCGPEEKYLLFMACLVSTNLVQFHSPLPAKKLSEVFIISELPNMLALSNWIASRPSIRKVLPGLVISKDTAQQQIYEFVHILLHAKNVGVSLNAAESYDELAVDIEERRQFRRALAATKSNKKEYFNLTISWAIQNLTLTRGIEESTVSMLQKVLTDKVWAGRYPLSVVKNLRGICIEFLPEEKSDDYIRKMEIKSALDDIIVDRLAILQSLGNAEESTAAKEEIKNVAQSYIITLNDGREFQNSAAPTMQKIAALSLSESLDSEEKAEDTSALKGTPPPVSSQFKNQMLYMIASAKWKKENNS